MGEVKLKSFKANNGDICSITIDENSEVFVYEDDDYEDDIDRRLGFLRSVDEYFFGYSDKYDEGKKNVILYAGPGSKADTEHHVKAFLAHHFYGEASTEQINAVTKTIDEMFQVELQ